MESKLDDHVSMVFSQPNITAVQCISLDGLCLTSRGSTNDLTCGLLSSVYKHAQWKDDETESPVVVIEQDSGSVTLCSSGDVLTAIRRSKASR